MADSSDINNEELYQMLFEVIRSKSPKNFCRFSFVESEKDLLENPVFNKLMEDSPTVIGIHNFATVTYEYFSPNIRHMFGFDPKLLIGTDGAVFAIGCYHPDYLAIYSDKIVPVIMNYFNEYSALKKVQDLRFSMTTKLRRTDGTYVWTLMQTLVLETTPNGFPLRTIFFLSDISGLKSDNKIDMTVAVKNSDGLGYHTLYSAHHEQGKVSELSQRELEIVMHVCKGKKSAEIAELMNISLNTVKTHRRNILTKTGKDNIIQLLNY